VNQALLIKSSSGAAELRLDPIDCYHYLVTLRDTGMDAVAKVYQHGGGDGLAEFFAALASEWRGWEGTRSWESLEGTFALDAEVDRTGHVTLTASVNDDTPWHWRVQSVLIAEVGQLDRLARDAAVFCGFLEAAT
jgi:hypothetical protein